MRKLFSLFVAFVATTTLWAYDFKSGDLYYNITSETTVEVTYPTYTSSNYVSLTSIAIPSTVTYNGTTYSVTRIGNEAFHECSGLTSVTIPNSVTSIGTSAFYDCSGLTSITIPNSVTSVGGYAFDGCSRLKSVTIGNSVTSIGNQAFYGCSGLKSIVWNAKNYADFSSSSYAPFSNISSKITSFTFGDSVQHIPAYLCYGMSKLTSITIPNSVTSIGSSAFYDCYGLTSVTIGNSVTSIGKSAFAGCSGLTSVTIGNSVTSIGDLAFYGCSGLTSVTIPNSVTSIGSSAFSGSSGLTSITIPNSVMSIGSFAFQGCSGLREISLGSGLKTIGADAFMNCPRIYEVTCLAQEPPVAEQSSFTNYDAYFHAPCDAQRYYSVDPVWKNFHNVECIVTDETVMDDITITPSDCEATVVWLSHDQAATYSLVITKKGETYCTLTFNKYGQLINIALAPARVRAKQDAAEYTETGYSFTITGLEMGTTYDYTFAVLNDSQNIIDQHFGHFTTKQNSPTDLENTHSPSPMANRQKVIRDGQLIILRDGVEYNAQGQIIKE